MSQQPVVRQEQFSPEQIDVLVKVYTYILNLNVGKQVPVEGDRQRLGTYKRPGKVEIEK